MRLYPGAVKATVWRDHSPAEGMDRETIRPERHHLVSRPFRLETAGRLCDRATDPGRRAPRGDCSLPRYPQADGRCDARYTRCACGKRVQVCDRQSTDCYEQAQEQPQPEPAITTVG